MNEITTDEIDSTVNLIFDQISPNNDFERFDEENFKYECRKILYEFILANGGSVIR